MVHLKDVKLTLQPKVILKRLADHEIRKLCFDQTKMGSFSRLEVTDTVTEIPTGTHKSSSQNGCHSNTSKGKIPKKKNVPVPELVKKIECEPASNGVADTVRMRSKCNSIGSKRISTKRKRPRKMIFSEKSSTTEESRDHSHTSNKKVRLSNQTPTEHQVSSTASVENGENVQEKEPIVQSHHNGTSMANNEKNSATNEDSSISREVRLSLLKHQSVEVHPDVARHLKPYQHDGVHFLWNKLIIKPLLTSGHTATGCILSQPSGSGKSAQVIAFLHRVLTNENVSDLNTALILCRKNNIDHWMAEFSNWVPKECAYDSRILLHCINLDSLEDEQRRAVHLRESKLSRGVVICDYQTFQSLVKQCNNTNSNVTYVENILTPDILICDDGQSLLHAGTSLVQCLEKVKTKRKLFLTNAPIQNNLMEYHCMISLVDAKLLGDVKVFRQRFVNPIENGQHVDSTEIDVKLMKQRGYILQELLSEYIQRKDITSLIECIPQKYEYTIKVKLTEVQALLYTKYLTRTTASSKSNQVCLYQDYHQLLLIACHPRCLIMQKEMQDKDVFQLSHRNEERSQNSDDTMRKSDDDDDNFALTRTSTTSIEDIHALSKDKIRLFIESKSGECPKTKSRMKLVNTAAKYLSKFFCKSKEYEKLLMNKSVIELKAMITKYGGNFNGCTEKNDLVNTAQKLAIQNATALEREWFEIFMQNTPCTENRYGGKIILMLKILQESCRLGDKIVIFSQSLITLDLIELVLEAEAKVSKATLCAPFCKWEKNKDYFRIDGSIENSSRSTMISHFNDQSYRRGRLLLVLSTTSHMIASLTSANRVILFDSSWCPSGDIQAISKVHRLGQNKPCYIYRLITHGTVEEKIYEKNFLRISFSYRADINSRVPKHFTAADIATMYKFEPKQEKSVLNAPIQDTVFSSVINSTDYVASFHAINTSSDCQVACQLTQGERKSAWAEYRVDTGTDVETSTSQLFIRRINSLPHHVLRTLYIQGSDLLEDIEKKIAIGQTFKRPLDNMMMQTRMNNRSISTEQATRDVIEQALKNHIELRRLDRLKMVLMQHLDAVQTAFLFKSTNISTTDTNSGLGRGNISFSAPPKVPTFGRGGPNLNLGNISRPRATSVRGRARCTFKFNVPLLGGRAFQPYPSKR